MRKFFWQVVRVHASVRRYKCFLCAVFDQRKVATPLILYPNSIKMFRSSAENNHYLGGVERSKYVRLVSYAKLIFQRNAREKDLKTFTGQLVIKLGSQYAVLRSPAVSVCFLVANEHIKGLFLLRNRKDTLLDLIDGGCLRFIYLALIAVCVGNSRFIIFVIENRCKLRAVYRRNTPAGAGIFYIFDSVAAKNNRPIRFRIGVVLVQNVFVYSHRLIKVVVATEVVGSVVKIGTTLIIELRKRLLCATIFTGGNRLGTVYFKRTTTNFTLKDSHDVPPYLLSSIISRFSME